METVSGLQLTMIVSNPSSRSAKRRVDAAVVELDPLPDPVGAAAEDHDLPPGGRLRLALLLVRRVEIGGACCKLGRAGVDALEHRPHAERDPTVPDGVAGRAEQVREPPIGESAALQVEQLVASERLERRAPERLFPPHEVLDLGEKPRIDAGRGVDLVEREAATERVGDVPDAVRADVAELDVDRFEVGGLLVEAVDADLQPA